MITMALRNKIEQLRSRANDITEQLQCEEMQPAKKRRREVDSWLRNVWRTEVEADTIVTKDEGSWFFSSSVLAKKTESKLLEVEQLLEQGKFPHGLVLDDLEFKGARFLGPQIKQQVSKEALETIWNYLTDEGELRVGICGMGGVGKTTLAMHINNRIVNSTSPFSHVYWVTVTKETSTYKLQNGIARALKLGPFDVEDEKVRASVIYEAFTKTKEAMLILDDVWEPISMEDVGVPVKVGTCKLLITSRSISTCRRMKCKEFKVHPLPQKDAWNLFMDELENYDALSVDVKEISKLVAEECHGLPLGIVVMARYMRGIHYLHEWRTALTELRDSVPSLSDMEERVFQVLNFSYTRLKNERLQKCFIYCALFPEDSVIHRENLINHFIASKLVDVARKRHEQFDEGHTTLNVLENACLLEPEIDFFGNRCVKMHDLVRDMAISIINKTGAMIKAGKGLKQMPREETWTSDLTWVSLMDNAIACVDPIASPMCSNLSILLLQRNPLKNISNSFFQHMLCLKVLDLSHTRINSLPNSISELQYLNALFLEFCNELKEVTPLTKLKELRELNLCNTGIQKLPQGLENLANLRLLGLHDSFSLESFPAGLLPQLSNLELLTLPLENAAVEAKEVIELKHLEIFQGHFIDLPNFNHYVGSKHHDQLKRYFICAGCWSLKAYLFKLASELDYHIDLFSDNAVALCFSSVPPNESSFLLPCSTANLIIKDCCSWGMFRSLWNATSSIHAGSNLKRCILENCHGLEHITSCHSSAIRAGQDIVLERLEVMILNNLPDLYSLFGTGIALHPCDTFRSLKHLFICNCPRIKTLIPLDQLKHHLQNLEFLKLKSCAQMEEIFVTELGDIHEQRRGMLSTARSDHSVPLGSAIILPKLRIICLWNLPALTTLCCKMIICNSLQHVQIIGCENLKKNPISIRATGVGRKATLFANRCWWKSCEWHDPSSKFEFMLIPHRHPSI